MALVMSVMDIILKMGNSFCLIYWSLKKRDELIKKQQREKDKLQKDFKQLEQDKADYLAKFAKVK